MPKEKPFRPAPAVFAAPSPEASLCLHFINEAQLAGWRAIPEYPKSRFDILLIAEDWVQTAGAVPGDQIGVQAKMNFSTDLMRQLREHVTRQRKWNNPDYIVGLVPQVPSTPAAKKKLESLEYLGIGLLSAYTIFNGNQHETTTATVNLEDIKKLGHRHPFPGRIPPPRDDYPFVLPGSVGGQHWSEWKDRAMKFLIEVHLGDGTLMLSDFRKGKLDPRLWLNKGWVTRTGQKLGTQDIYKLNPESRSDRPDLMHPYEFVRQLEERRNEQEESRTCSGRDKTDTGE